MKTPTEAENQALKKLIEISERSGQAGLLTQDEAFALVRVTRVQAKPNYVLALEFSDSTSGELSLAEWLFAKHRPVFEPLKDPKFFAQVALDGHSSICWPNGADLDPLVLHHCINKQPPNAETQAALAESEAVEQLERLDGIDELFKDDEGSDGPE